ncbi:MAG: hypothetical protein K1Y01_04525 [Vicinamibacteria bacterium]|nr:hypothetical protein [Vicinamibacteria bacterium]
MDAEIVVSVVLFVAYVAARVAAYRSAWREQGGACFRCAKEEPIVKLGGREFCERCAEITLRNYRMGFRFFVFLGILMALFATVLIHRLGLAETLRGLGPMAKDLALVLVGLAGATIWIHKAMRRQELR